MILQDQVPIISTTRVSVMYARQVINHSLIAFELTSLTASLCPAVSFFRNSTVFRRRLGKDTCGSKGSRACLSGRLRLD